MRRPPFRSRLKAAWFALRGEAVMINIAVQAEEDGGLWFGIWGETTAATMLAHNNCFSAREVFFGAYRMPVRELHGVEVVEDDPDGGGGVEVEAGR